LFAAKNKINSTGKERTQSGTSNNNHHVETERPKMRISEVYMDRKSESDFAPVM
jgi:hypothetical protein